MLECKSNVLYKCVHTVIPVVTVTTVRVTVCSISYRKGADHKPLRLLTDRIV